MRFKEQNCQILSVTNTENCTIAQALGLQPCLLCHLRAAGSLRCDDPTPGHEHRGAAGKKLYRYTSEGMSTLTKDKQSLEAMYRKGWQDAEKLVQWYRAAKAEA